MVWRRRWEEKQIVEQLSDVATVEGAELAAHLP
jgi:hypothetical protein